MKVAIWGSYEYGNFGDYVMGLLIAAHLKKEGCEPWLFRLQPHLADQYGFKTTTSLEELFSDAQFGLWAGGTLMLEPLHGKVGSSFNSNIRKLSQILDSTACPFYFVNGGGDGSNFTDRTLTHFQWKIITTAFRSGTLRLKADQELFNELGVDAQLLPDIAFGVSKLWPTEAKTHKSKKPYKIGLCIPDNSEMRRLATFLGLSAKWNRQFVYHFFHPHLKSIQGAGRTLMPRESKWIKHHYLTEPGESVKFIASLDLLVSHYMHPIVVALAKHVPIWNLDKRSKSIAVLEEHDLGFTCFSTKGKDISRLFKTISSSRRFKDYQSRFDFEKITQLTEESEGHWDYMTKIIDSHREKSSG
jgi:polysaccharide pyruvyl transferase WcaK-like protein